jgi:hypothetical protein
MGVNDLVLKNKLLFLEIISGAERSEIELFYGGFESTKKLILSNLIQTTQTLD